MLTTFLVLSPERPNFPVQFVGILHATCECIYIDKIIISSSFEQISFRSISHSRNLSHHNFRCSPSYSKTRMHGLVRFPYIIVERKTLKLFLAEKKTPYLGSVIYMENLAWCSGGFEEEISRRLQTIQLGKLTVR